MVAGWCLWRWWWFDVTVVVLQLSISWWESLDVCRWVDGLLLLLHGLWIPTAPGLRVCDFVCLYLQFLWGSTAFVQTDMLFTLLSSSVRSPNSCVYYVTYALPIVFIKKRTRKQRLNKVLILYNSFLVFLPGYDQDALPELSDFRKKEKGL